MFRHATTQDMVGFYGSLPRHTAQAVVVLLGGRPAGVAGVAIENGVRKFFTDFKDELAPYLSTVTVWRALKAALAFARSPTYTVATMDAERFLPRLGFTHMGGNVWRA